MKSGFLSSEMTLGAACAYIIFEIATRPVDSWPVAVVTAVACASLAYIAARYATVRNEVKQIEAAQPPMSVTLTGSGADSPVPK